MRRLFYAGVVLLSMLAAETVQAHPHAWIDCEITARFDARGLAGFQQNWIFDEMFSATFIDEFDQDKNRVIDSAENARLKAEAFDNLKNFGYFNDIRIDGTTFPVQFVTEFQARIDGAGRLVYEFFIPCHVTAISTFKTVAIGVYDQSFYSDIGYTESTPQWAGATSGLVVDSRQVEFSDTFFEVIRYSPKGFEIRFKTQ